MMTYLRQLLCVLTLSLASASYSAALSEQESAYLSAREEIVFICQPDQAPYEFIHDNLITGMNVELVQWMAADLGFKIRFVTAAPKEGLDLLRNGKADVLTSIHYSTQLDEEFSFSQTLSMTPVSLFVKSDRADIVALDSLNDRNVAIIGSGQTMEVLQQQGVRSKNKFVIDTAACVDLVIGGQADAMISNELLTQHYLERTEQRGLKLIGKPIYTTRLCMAIYQDDVLLGIINKGISNAQRNGTLNRIQAKWIGSDHANNSIPLPDILTLSSASLSLVALIIALILLWNRRLQRKVDERTRQYADSEDRLRQIFENSPDAVLVLDREGQILSANGRACELVKLSKADLLIRRVHDLAPKIFQNEVEENMRLWFSGELTQCEGVSEASNGELTPIDMTGSLQKMGSQKVLQLHIRDITLRKEAEEKIHAAREMAEEAKIMAEEAREIAENASQAKSEFLANMSHEIRTPLNGIVGMAQLISDTHLNEEQKSCLETIHQSSNGLLKVINHVLDISKIEAGQMDVRTAIFDLREMCNGLIHRFKQQADQADISLKCTCQENLPLYVNGDEGLIEQILINLIGNALKFTHKGSVTLNIECHQKTARGAELYFQVIDTGIGISTEKQASIFNKFTQADGSTKRLYGGTGLGLAICKQLVELMGGTIGLISSVGQGSTFFFNLTLEQASHPAAPKEPSGSHDKIIHKPNAKVLLVEDNLVNQKVATAILHKAGCQVDTADNGQDAIQQVRTSSYDLVLMDCQMPVMDGFEATARIRAMEKPLCDLPIIAITAHAMKDDKQKCLDGGMNDYISKPVSRQELIDLINKYIG